MQQYTIFGCEVEVYVDRPGAEGRVYLAYVAIMPNGAAFAGRNYSPSPLCGDPEGLRSAMELLAFLCLQPGDTDREYFDDYSPEQRAWAESFECECIKGTLDEAIVLHDPYGFFSELRGGVDQYGREWSTFEVDRLADQEDGECSICGAELSSGFLCGDGADEVCADHIYLFTEDEANAYHWNWIGNRLVNA